ncbi:hypothetical protein FIV34_11960 [Luteibacter pinisoli]|uniref:Uncharacterized protein n=1 Tax=Luteibacter pinisoli TaxID=2589080 RepID=A0A4Y5Z452_9GAMM|nr:hypothetical protein [Luteibacter pinisoli]QDE39874.1 hypothetical protein FIV34_11960 [Luteibacter pinisoli]
MPVLRERFMTPQPRPISPVMPASGGVPPEDAVVGYFASLGYPLFVVRPDGVHAGEPPFWRLDRPVLYKPCETFDTIADVWNWWERTAVWVLTADTHFRLLCAFYRGGGAMMRAEMREWATPQPRYSLDTDWTRDLVGHWPPFRRDDLPPDWVELMREVERACVTPGERCRDRFLRYCKEWDESEERRYLEASIHPSRVLGTRRRL